MNQLIIKRVSGASKALDALAEASDPRHAFLRAAWFEAGAGGAPISTLVVRRAGSGEPLMALPLVERGRGPARIREVPGSYWPYRSFPISADLTEDEFGSILRHPDARKALGRALRIGPIYSDDPAGTRLLRAAQAAGWTILTRRVATCYMLDLARRRAEGPWPSVKTARKNRWQERRLGGEVEYRSFSGAEWTPEVIDLLAGIERESWHGRTGGDTKFLDPAMRRTWELVIRDPALAPSLACTILYVGEVPAAFVFTLTSGTTLHCIANSYSERFREQSPGRILLYREFALALERGMDLVDWGGGDAGYKTEMGGETGPEIEDHLLVRGRLLGALLRPLWNRGSN